MKLYLKIKIKTLAAEATMIRLEERKQNPGSRARVKAKQLLAGNEPPLGRTDEELAAINRAKRILRKPTEKQMDRFWGLRGHRRLVVRVESRASHIAYGFLRGLDFKRIENKSKTEPDWDKVKSMIERFGEDDVRERMQRFAEWKDAATAA